METYIGHVKTPADAIVLFEACRLGLLPRVQRRLSEKERQQIKSGSVFVWDEREAGMRRWTDGKSWSASRVNGSFLTYREMEGKRGSNSASRTNSAPEPQEPDSNARPTGVTPVNYNRYGMETPEGYRYKIDGLTKQSFSIMTSTGQHLHLIAYFTRERSGGVPKLMQPTNDPKIRHIRPAKGMYPESTVQDGNSMPAMTQSPMMGPPYASSPGQHSAATTPQYAQPRSMYNHPQTYGWPPSPMSTPPMHYSSYQNGYPSNASNHSPMYYRPPPLHQRVSAPQGQTAFDRAPPPLSGGSIPQPPAANGYDTYGRHGIPPTSTPTYPPAPPPPNSTSYPGQHGPPNQSTQHNYPNNYNNSSPRDAQADPRLYQQSSQYYQGQPYPQREQEAPAQSSVPETSDHSARPASTSGVIPSINHLINKPESLSRTPNGQQPSSSGGGHDQQDRDSGATSGGEKSGFHEDKRAIRQLDRAFAP